MILRLLVLALAFLVTMGISLTAQDAPPMVAPLTIDPTQRFQTIEGFGVNFNGVYYRDAQRKLIDLLVDDLGITMVRFDPYGQTDWEMENDDDDPTHINWDVFDDRFSTAAFEASWAALREFNKRGMRVLLTVSGTVPPWMLDDQGGPLNHPTCNKEPNAIHPFTNRPSHLRHDMYPEFAETIVAMASYARKKAGVKFDWLGINETNCFPIEGPRIDPEEGPDVVRAIVAALDREGMSDMNLVYADQAMVPADYFSPVREHPDLMKRIARFSLHQYGGSGAAEYQRHFDRLADTTRPSAPVWISEYGDLNDKDRSDKNEWDNFSVKTTRNLLSVLGVGATAAMWWDAFDNYHDHDRHMTYYGLVAQDRHRYTPKKRFYAQRQLYRFVRPGAVRVGITGGGAGLEAQAFVDDKTRRVTVVGVASRPMDVVLQVQGAASTRWRLVVTTPTLNGASRDSAIERTADGIRVRLDEPAVFTLISR